MKEVVATKNAPEAIGPYSQAIRCGNLLFVSGQIPIDPKSGGVVDGGIEKQTEMVLRNLGAILEAAGAGLGDVVKCSCFLRNMEDFPRFNAIYGTVFTVAPPARETVEVSRLPKDVLVEVSAICVIPA
jgi:2-iminobutanoate/2-iminopropanoate deaminase